MNIFSQKESEIQTSFRKYIQPYLKHTGLVLDEGFNARGMRYDFIIRSFDRITHIIEIKRAFTPDAINKLKQYQISSISNGCQSNVSAILACFDDAEWKLYGVDGQRINAEQLRKDIEGVALSIPRIQKSLHSMSLTLGGLLVLIGICELVFPFLHNYHCHGSGNNSTALLVIAGCIFAILPYILPYIKEFRTGICTIIFTDQHNLNK